LEPGTCFALSSLIPGSVSQNSAICAESCELLTLPAQELHELFSENNELGYLFMYRIMRIFKERMDHRTQLFLRALENHPELQELFSE
jgi:CRP-like cAMP-binding protein